MSTCLKGCSFHWGQLFSFYSTESSFKLHSAYSHSFLAVTQYETETEKLNTVHIFPPSSSGQKVLSTSEFMNASPPAADLKPQLSRTHKSHGSDQSRARLSQISLKWCWITWWIVPPMGVGVIRLCENVWCHLVFAGGRVVICAERDAGVPAWWP